MMSRSLVKQNAVPPDGLEPRLVTLLTPIAFEAESYRILGYLLTQMRKDVGLHVVAISSPSGGDGKTTTAINLAGLLAQDPGVRVLLVEAELRLPKIMAYLGLRHTGSPGLVEAILEPSLSLESVVQQPLSFDFDILPAGRGGTTTLYLYYCRYPAPGAVCRLPPTRKMGGRLSCRRGGKQNAPQVA
jgi:Mrp family chromosome partitioning ATPase